MSCKVFRIGPIRVTLVARPEKDEVQVTFQDHDSLILVTNVKAVELLKARDAFTDFLRENG